MEKLSRDQRSTLLQLEFKTVNQFNYSHFWYLSITSLHIVALVFTVIQRIPYPIVFALPYSTLFIVLSSTFALFVLVTLLAYSRGVLLNFWGYFLLFHQAIMGLVTEVGVKCFANECWCAGELKYQILVIVVFGILFISVSVLRMFYYYPFRDPTKVLSIENGYTTIFFSIYKLTLSVLFNISTINDPATYKSSFFLLSILLFVISGNPFHYYLSKRVWNIIHISTLWTATILYISPNLFELSFSHSQDGNHIGLYLWLFSIPFVVIFTYAWGRQTKWQKFFQTVHLHQDKQTTMDSISQLTHELNEIKKSQLKSFNPVYKQLLELMEKHTTECQVSHCFIKQYEKEEYLVKDEKMQSKRMKKNLEMCFRAAEDKLETLLTKQPSNIQLIIYIANFLFLSMRAKFKALSLYNDRSFSKKLSIVNFYSLFYLKNSIESLNSQREQMNLQSLETQVSEFQRNIQVSVSMLTEFWYMLSNNKCDLKKLYDLANTIFPLKMQVDKMWMAIETYKNIDSYNLYARYLIQIFNDKERGLKILQQTKKIDAQIKNRQQLQMGLESSGNIIDQNGLLFVELGSNNVCRIFQSNIALERMLGYGKSQLVDEQANILIPKPLADHHDFMVEKYHLTGKTVIMNKQNNNYIKNKAGYLIPVTMIIKPIKNFYSQKTQVYATFKPQLQLKELICIYTTEAFIITEVTSSALTLFPNLTPPNIARRKIYADQIIPNCQEFLKKNDRNLQEIEFQRKYEIDGVTRIEKIPFTVDIAELKMSGRGLVGYQIKLGKLSNKYSDIKNVPSEITTFYNDFRFTVEVSKDKQNNFSESKQYIHFIGACNVSEQINQLFIQSSNSRWIKSKMPKAVSKNRINYSEGIEVRRLENNQIVSFRVNSQLKRSLTTQLMQQNNATKEAGDEVQEDQQGSGVNPNIVRSSQLSNLLLKEKGNKKVKTLKMLELSVVVSAIILMVTQYSLISTVKNTISDGLNRIKLLHQMQAEILYINQYSIYHGIVKPTNQSNKDFLKDINELDMMQKDLVLNGQALLTYSDGSSQKLLLNFALNKLISTANMAHQIETLYDPLDTNIFFINFNCLNDLLLSIDRQIAALSDSIREQLQNQDKNNKLFLALAFPLMFVMTAVTNILLFNIMKKKTEILEVFFQIPRKTCKAYMKECQVFIQKLASDNQDFEIQSIDGDETQAADASDNDTTKKKRSVEGQDQIWSGFIMAALAFVLYLCSFEISVYVYKGNNRPTIQNSSSLIKQLTSIQKELVFSANAMNTLFSNNSMTILNTISFEETQIALNNSLFNLRSSAFDFQTSFFSVKRKYSPTFIDRYNHIVFGNLCVNNQTGCSFLSRGFGYMAKLGMKYVQMKYDSYVSYVQTNNIGIRDQQLNQTTLSFELYGQEYMKLYYRKLSGILLQAIQLILTQIDTVVFAVMLSLIGGSFLILYFGWYKFFELIERQIMATEYILTFIPITQINKNPRISNYVRVHMLQRGD